MAFNAPQSMYVSRQFAIAAMNELRDPWARAKALYNFGIRGGTTRDQVRWLLDNGTFA